LGGKRGHWDAVIGHIGDAIPAPLRPPIRQA
jgi:hypothetical protein